MIDLSSQGGGSITLTGVSTSDLDADDFIFYQNVFTGTAYRDRIEGGAGDDTITGGGRADTFVFRDDSANDTITDFSTADGDKIDLTRLTATVTWAVLSTKIATIADPNDPNVVTGLKIDLTDFGGGTITLTGLTAVSDLTEDMFILDKIAGTNDDDTLESGSTDDILMGGGGADTFVFEPGNGRDTITDFTVDTDKIDLTAFTGITSLDDLVYWQSGGDTLIYLRWDGGGTIRLEGVSPDDLDADDFIFYQDEYTGTASAETLTGGAGDDTITGLGGDDTLTGGEGYDTFVFAAGHGADTVTDFTDGVDLIDLSAFTGIAGYSDLTVTQNGNDVVIDLSGQTGGGSITLQDFTLSDLDENDFVFYEATPDGG